MSPAFKEREEKQMTYSIRSAIVAGMAGAACLAAADTKVWLDEMPVKDTICVG